MNSADSTTDIKLDKAEALVLFELLATFYNQPCLEVRTAAEKLALVRLHGALEKVLVEPFMPEYLDLVEKARSNLTTQAQAA